MASKHDEFTKHDWGSPAYVEEWIKQDLQRDEERRLRIREMLSLAPVPQTGAIDVLDVGGGYGVVTEEVLRTFPQARVILQDYSQSMLDHARQRLSDYAGRVSYVLADLCDPSWPHRVDGPFDLIVSSYAIHNLRDPEPIRACYRAIAGLLKAGAPFLHYDIFDHAGGVVLHSNLLRESGFARVNCVWQQTPDAIMVAYSQAGKLESL
jgi:ubiquinone/menaquinone biosynthesis C-methylase UbiE